MMMMIMMKWFMISHLSPVSFLSSLISHFMHLCFLISKHSSLFLHLSYESGTNGVIPFTENSALFSIRTKNDDVEDDDDDDDDDDDRFHWF